MKLMNCAAGVLSVALLTACQGQNLFKRESNPVRNYPRVADSINKRESAVAYGQKQNPPGNANDCSGPFIVRSNSPTGSTFYFLEGSSADFEISIINRLGDNFEVTATNMPEGAEFKLLRQTSPNSAAYQLAWTPKNIAEDSARAKVTLQLRSKALSDRCQGAMGTEDLHLMVEKLQGHPVASANVTQQTALKFGKDMSFTIDIVDPSAKVNQPPTLEAISFDPGFKNESTAQVPVIDGSKAADCAKSATNVDGKWQFKCKFLSSALQADNEDQLRGSGKTAQAVFTVTGKGANLKRTNTLKISVQVLFERVARGAQGRRP